MNPAFWALQEALERQGPGTPEDTHRAWAAIDPLRPPVPAHGASSDSPARSESEGRSTRDDLRIVDMGAGTGGATKALLTASAGSITALEQHAPFVAQLDGWVQANGFEDRVTAVVGDMADHPFEDGSFDVVWSEGAAYAIGFERALRTWRSLLSPGGYLGVSELVWTTDTPSPEPRAFFDAEYADMKTARQRRQDAKDAGYRLLDDFMVSKEGWWEGYYAPLLAQLSRMEGEEPPEKV